MNSQFSAFLKGPSKQISSFSLDFSLDFSRSALLLQNSEEMEGKEAVFFIMSREQLYGINLSDLLKLKDEQPTDWKSVALPFQFSLPLPTVNNTKYEKAKPHYFIINDKLYVVIGGLDRNDDMNRFKDKWDELPWCEIYNFDHLNLAFKKDYLHLSTAFAPFFWGNVTDSHVCGLETGSVWNLGKPPTNWVASSAVPPWTRSYHSIMNPFAYRRKLYIPVVFVPSKPPMLYSFNPVNGFWGNESNTLNWYHFRLSPDEEPEYYIPSVYVSVSGLSPVGIHCHYHLMKGKLIIAAVMNYRGNGRKARRKNRKVRIYHQTLDECFDEDQILCSRITNVSLADLGAGMVCAVLIGTEKLTRKRKRRNSIQTKGKKLLFISVFSLSMIENFSGPPGPFLNVKAHLKRVFKLHEEDDEFNHLSSFILGPIKR